MPLDRIDIWGQTDIGLRRADNQDTIYFVDVNKTDTVTTTAAGYLFAVADGVGGQSGGKQASEQLIDQLHKLYYQSKISHIPSRLQHAIAQANQLAHTTTSSPYAATTLVAAVIHDEQLYVAYAGDSRAYLLRNGQAKQLTTDHTLEGRLFNFLVANPEAAPDVLEPIALQAGDRILLCSDGLSGLVSDSAEISDMATIGRIKQTVPSLIEIAKARGGYDNISVVMADIRPKPTLNWLRLTQGIAAFALLILVFTSGILLGGWRPTFDSAETRPTPIIALAAITQVPDTPMPTATSLPITVAAPTDVPLVVDVVRPNPTSTTQPTPIPPPVVIPATPAPTIAPTIFIPAPTVAPPTAAPVIVAQSIIVPTAVPIVQPTAQLPTPTVQPTQAAPTQLLPTVEIPATETAPAIAPVAATATPAPTQLPPTAVIIATAVPTLIVPTVVATNEPPTVEPTSLPIPSPTVRPTEPVPAAPSPTATMLPATIAPPTATNVPPTAAPTATELPATAIPPTTAPPTATPQPTALPTIEFFNPGAPTPVPLSLLTETPNVVRSIETETPMPTPTVEPTLIPATETPMPPTATPLPPEPTVEATLEPATATPQPLPTELPTEVSEPTVIVPAEPTVVSAETPYP